MNILKFTQYIYLAFALFFIYDGFVKWQTGDETMWLSFVIAAVCIIMFFFRRRFAKKFDDRNNNS